MRKVIYLLHGKTSFGKKRPMSLDCDKILQSDFSVYLRIGQLSLGGGPDLLTRERLPSAPINISQSSNEESAK